MAWHCTCISVNPNIVAYVYIIFQACNNGMSNSVCTLYELSNGDDTANEGEWF